MKDQFNPDEPHEHNVKVAIDKIIGQTTEIKRKKRSELDQKRILFKRIIEGIIDSEQRTTAIEEAFMIDFNKYNKVFFDIIEDFLRFSFTKDQLKIIDFYLYDRYSPDGRVLQLLNPDNTPIKLDTVDELWYLLKSMDNDNKRSTNN